MGVLPKTGTFLPLVDLLGVLSLAAFFGLKAFRRTAKLLLERLADHPLRGGRALLLPELGEKEEHHENT